MIAAQKTRAGQTVTRIGTETVHGLIVDKATDSGEVTLTLAHRGGLRTVVVPAQVHVTVTTRTRTR